MHGIAGITFYNFNIEYFVSHLIVWLIFYVIIRYIQVHIVEHIDS